jgi:hypothetical protein
MGWCCQETAGGHACAAAHISSPVCVTRRRTVPPPVRPGLQGSERRALPLCKCGMRSRVLGGTRGATASGAGHQLRQRGRLARGASRCWRLGTRSCRSYARARCGDRGSCRLLDRLEDFRAGGLGAAERGPGRAATSTSRGVPSGSAMIRAWTTSARQGVRPRLRAAISAPVTASALQSRRRAVRNGSSRRCPTRRWWS